VPHFISPAGGTHVWYYGNYSQNYRTPECLGNHLREGVGVRNTDSPEEFF
jgi:hypothetical protein